MKLTLRILFIVVILGGVLFSAARRALPFGNPPSGPRLEIARFFDRNHDGKLDPAERVDARIYAALQPASHPRGGQLIPEKPGPRLTPADVRTYDPEVGLFDIHALRTVFLQFDTNHWEQELVDFFGTDIRLPVTMTVDGKTYPDVGVSFRGHTSYNAIPDGGKRSFDIELDGAHPEQRLLGFRALNLLNANADPTYLRTFLYNYVARQYLPAPRTNFVRVVINGESWGVYANTEQINSDLTRDQFGSTEGARWKIPGNPRGSGGLEYLGPSASAYRDYYEIKSKDRPKSWNALIKLCAALDTDPATLESAVSPLLDIDGALRFLAVDCVLLNNDGYWTRASDYYIYQDPKGLFHPIPWDANETWREPNRGGGVTIDPLQSSHDPGKALYRLSQVPALREKYLTYVRDIATTWLDWKTLGPLVEEMQQLLLTDMETDYRKQFSTESFLTSPTQDLTSSRGQYSAPRISLKSFADTRRAYLLNLPTIKALPTL